MTLVSKLGRMHERQDAYRVSFGALVLAVATGVVVGLGGDAQRPALMAGLALLTPLPLLIRGLQGKFDPFEPINFYALGIFFLFVLRPAFELTFNSRLFGSYSDYAGFDGALTIALAGTAALYVGYGIAAGVRLGYRLPTLRDNWSPQTVAVMCVGLVLLGLLLFAAFAAQLGQSIGAATDYFRGRSENSPSLRQSTAYLYLGPYLVVPATLLLLTCWQRDRRQIWLVGALLTGSLALLITVPRGDRTYVLTFLLPLLVLPYLHSGRRPRLTTIAVLIALVIPFLNVLLTVRNVSTRTDVTQRFVDALSRPDRSFKEFMLGLDTSMFTVLGLTSEIVPSRIPHAPGRVITATLAAPVPGLLWAKKPTQGDQVVYNNLFPQQAAVTRAGNASGFFGGFFFDGGLPGVVLYSLFIGIVSRALWEWWLRHGKHHLGATLIFATALPFIIVLQRGNISDTTGRSVFFVLPVVVVLWLATRRVRVPGRG